MKPSFVLLLMMTSGVMGWGQEMRDDAQVVRSVAERILAHGELAFRDTVTGTVYRSTAEAPQNARLVLANHFGEWHYTNGVLNMAFVDLTAATGDKRYAAYAAAHCAFGMDNYRWFEKRYKPEDGLYNTVPFGQLWTMRELDDCGAMAASMIDVLPAVQRDDFRAYIDRTAKHIAEKQLRLADGTLARSFPPGGTIWGDDLYMSVPFLARMGKLTGDRRYWDDAVHQVQAFTHYLWDPRKELYFHCYYAGLQRNGVAHWGRCNGWVMMAKVHLLNALPEDHPGRAAVIRDLEQQILGIAQYQNADGLWHQLLDKDDSYVETSCSAMFTYCIARAVNQGWIDARYCSIARAGWEGLKKHKIHADGRVDDICIGTGIEDNLAFYYNRPARADEKHGLGAVIEAGIELMRLKR